MASGTITSWEIDGETMETVTDFICLSFKITADGDCSHEIKRCLLLGRKAMTNLDSVPKSRDITLLTKVHTVKWKSLSGVWLSITHGIFQTRILELVAFPFSRGSSQPRDQTQVSCIAGGFFTSWATSLLLILSINILVHTHIYNIEFIIIILWCLDEIKIFITRHFCKIFIIKSNNQSKHILH